MIEQRKNEAPPQLLILLWHHFCYYKKHKVKFGFTIVLPFLYLFGVFALTLLLTNGNLKNLYEYPPNRTPLTSSPLSAGPLPAFISQLAEYSLLKFDFPTNLSNSHDRSPFDALLRYNYTVSAGSENFDHMGKQIDGFEEFPSRINASCRICQGLDPRTQSLEKDRTCVVLRHKILFYPNNSETVNRVMGHITGKLAEFVEFHQNFPDVSNMSVPFSVIGSMYKSCALPAKDRVIGFANKNDLVSYTKKLSSDLDTKKVLFIPNFWAAIGFDTTKLKSIDQVLKYRFIIDSSVLTLPKIDLQLHWLRDLVDDSIIWLRNGTESPFSNAYKELPLKCYFVPEDLVYGILFLVIPIVAVISFTMPPANFLEQVLVEKRLKLREYLYIMGVGNLRLKFSWILFYLLWLIPLAFVFSIVIRFYPGPTFARTDYFLLLLLFVLFNVAQLSFCYMLAAFLNTEKRSTIILVFINVFFLVLANSVFNTPSISGGTLVLARITSLHCVVPMKIAFSYIVSWEEIWVGAKWANAFHHTTKEDGYGGFGEAIIWLLVDTILYLIVAWYCEHASPGEFGVKQPFYFPILPSFWFPNKFPKEYNYVEPSDSADIEPTNGSEPGVVLNKLTKYYSADKVGVNQLSLTFHRNEVTAFLGENGAGKSTTLNSLVGLISATSGNAKVLGLDTHDRVDEVRKIIGFVPQYDILYPSMTVEEHMQFFGWLKGLSKSSIKELSDFYLTKFGLENARKTITTSLSGGQKRKLSILTAFLGDPQVIILDEPTSGVDPFSRRAIWDMVLTKRREATTILSTHFMQEADILGDRVAIISEGELKCSGTPMYLKNKYGHGFRLIVACDPQSPNKRAVKNFFHENVPNSYLKEERGFDLTFSVPVEFAASEGMVQFLKKLEEEQLKLSVSSYGLSEPTMEEVFFTSTDSRKGSESPDSYSENGDGMQLVESGEDGQLRATSDQMSSAKKSSLGLQLILQAKALMWKKMVYTAFSWSGYILQIILPLAFVVLMLLTGEKVGEIDGSSVSSVGLYRDFRTDKLFFSYPSHSLDPYLSSAVQNGLGTRCLSQKCTDIKSVVASLLLYDPSKAIIGTSCECKAKVATTSYCTKQIALTQPHQVGSDGNTVYRIGSSIDSTSNWVKFVNQSSNVVIGGFEALSVNKYRFTRLISTLERFNSSWARLIKNTTKMDYVVTWYKNDVKLAMGNAWSNLLLNSNAPKSGLEIQIEKLPLMNIQNNFFAQLIQLIQILYNSIFLDFAFAFGTFGIVVFVQYENASGLKRLQLLYGANPFVYWTVSLLFDFFLFLITLSFVLFCLGVFKNSFQDSLGQVTAAMLPYGLMSITFTYLLSFTSQKAKGIVIFTVISALIFFFAACILSVFDIINSICDVQRELLKSDCTRYTWAGPVSDVLRIIPSYYLADSLLYISLAPAIQRFYGSAIQVANPFGAPFSFQLLGKRILTGMASSIVYFIAVCLLEFFDVRINLTCSCKQTRQSAANPFRVIDEDVQREEERVNRPETNDPLLVKGLYKTYSGMAIPAVAGVTFGVPKNQCFGLLGINGAGKSTLFRMLTGYQRNTSGTAVMGGKDMFQSRGWSQRQSSSYCPQENTLFENLSAKHHLNLFATLRGIPSSEIPDLIDCLIKEVGLTPHVTKRAGQLSGGNQRKLQFAMALLDYCPVIFLDEPTTGMDPGARRMAWGGVRRAVARGCSVVLTSHSMEECEELCHRLVIMVAGAFQCIGSVQYLKDKFGNKYTFKLKIADTSIQSGEFPVLAVKNFILSKYPGVTLLEEHATMISFEIGADGIKLSELFAVLSQCRRDHPVEDFIVSQTTLEHVFVNMARVQEMLHSGFLLPASPHPTYLPAEQPVPPSMLPTSQPLPQANGLHPLEEGSEANTQFIPPGEKLTDPEVEDPEHRLDRDTINVRM